jgi:hypothetical protein
MGTEENRRLGRGVASSGVSRWQGFTVYDRTYLSATCCDALCTIVNKPDFILDLKACKIEFK